VWPPAALDFLRELESNNDRDWFKANRARYDADVVAPARALAEALAPFGEAHFFRPYNDARFHARPPIKEQLGVTIGYGPAGGYYFELSLDGLRVAAGLHHVASDQIERFRLAVDDDRRAAVLERALATAQAAGMELSPPALKRAPRGYPVDHRRIELLRRKSLTVSCRHALQPWLHSERCEELVREQLDAARPLVAWLAQHVGPPGARAGRA